MYPNGVVYKNKKCVFENLNIKKNSTCKNDGVDGQRRYSPLTLPWGLDN